MNSYLIAILALILIFIFYCHIYIFIKVNPRYEILQTMSPNPDTLEKLFIEKLPIVITNLVEEWVGINQIDEDYLKIQQYPSKNPVVLKLLNKFTQNYHLPFKLNSWYQDFFHPSGTKLELEQIKTHRHLIVQLQGKVKYILYHPGQDKFVYNGKVPFFGWEKLEEKEKEKYHDFPKGQYIELFLTTGKILHLPKGWWYARDIIDNSIQITVDSSSIFSVMIH